MASNRDWGVAPSFQTIPPFAGPSDPAIAFGTDPIPQRVIEAVQNKFGPNWQVVAVIQYRESETFYWFDALARATAPSPFADLIICRGNIDGSLDIISEYFGYSSVGGGSRIGLATSIGDMDTTIGQLGNAGIRIRKTPSVIPSRIEIAAGVIDLLSLGVTGVAMDGVSAPRALVAWAASQANTPAVGTGFQVVMDSPTATFRAGRAFDLEIGGTALTSLSTTVIEFAVNIVYTVGGEQTLWQTTSFGPSGANPPIDTRSGTVIVNSSGADKQGFLRVYIRAQNAGTVTWLGSATRPRWVRARDCGAATDYPGALVMP